MKKFLFETAKIVGTATDKAWSQVHTFSPTEEKKLSKRGQFLAVISLSELAEEIEAVAAGKEIISRLHEEYYGRLEKSALDQLKEALQQVLRETKEEAKVEIEAAALVGETIYFAVAGKGKILAQREGKMAKILVGEEKEVEVASGRAVGGDVFLIGSQKFFSLLAEEVIETALSAGSANETAETLMPLVHGKKEDGTAAAAVLRLESMVETKPEVLVPPGVEPEEEKKAKPVFLSGFKGSLKERFSFLLRQMVRFGRLLLFKIEKSLKRRAIYLSGEEKEKKRPQRTLMTVAVILLVLLVVSVILGARQRSRTPAGNQVATILKQAQTRKEEGEALIELNPIRARQLLLEARYLLDEISPEEANQAVFDFRAELEESLALVMREHEVEPKSYYDLVIIKDGAQGDDWAVSGEELIIFDKGKKTIYSLGVSDKQSTILAGGDDLADGQQVAAFLPKIYLLTERGILEFDKETKRKNLVIETDEEWREIVDFRAFGGNLYLLDKKGEIWKYPGVEGGFGVFRHWLKGEADFSDAVGMSIDGSVWVLEADGTILKFTQGGRDAFTISGLDKSLANPQAIFTDDDQENLYILDKDNSRVVVINKSGEYHSQYRWEGMGGVSHLMASEEEKKILLLSGNKVYEIEIR
jgi:hypothetical protein